MSAINIHPTVALQEVREENVWLRNRGMVQAQAIADLQAQVADLTARLAAAPVDPDADPA